MTHAQIERDEMIEKYLLRRLSPDEEAAFEEHYLGCQACQNRLREERRVIEGIRRASKDWQKRPHPRRQWLVPAPAWGVAALAAAALYVSVVLPPSVLRIPGRQPAPVAVASLTTVELHTYRTGGSEAARASANRDFLMRLDVQGAPAARDYAVEIVGETGESLWTRAGLRAAGQWVEAPVQGGLPAGRHLVRLSSQGRLLREYALRVEP
jgi:anti-sigma factor RsiW